MDRDRVDGALKSIGGRIKTFVGRLLGDEKLKTEGKVDHVEGRVQNTVGGIKDSLRDNDR